jgi:DNA invertase Pin-like site-specific DNA recombinase
VENIPNARALIYIRVSTAQQTSSGLSLEYQAKYLTEIVKFEGYSQFEIIQERGVSAKGMKNRPELNRALEKLRVGEASALYVAKVDRLARNTLDALKIAEDAINQGWRLRCLDINLDTNSPMSKFLFTMVAGLAEVELSRISERHKEWHKADLERGFIWGVNKGPVSKLAPTTLNLIHNLKLDGLSLREIAKELNFNGIKTGYGNMWSAGSVSHVIKHQKLCTEIKEER